MASLRDKTLSGIFWSFIQNIGGKGINVITTIILARILTPEDFGLIGMLAVFIALSQIVIKSGFDQALIQKKGTDEEDYSSVFYINLVVSIVLYGILYFCAPLIADFYSQPKLISLTRVLSLIFVINSFGYVQEAKLRKEMKFKKLAYVHVPSIFISGVVSITMALMGFGVWSIVGQQLSMQLAYNIQIWIYAKWKPLWQFNAQKAKKLFSFGGHLLLNGLLSTFFQNIYKVLIGKFFPVNQVGYYQNADSLTSFTVITLRKVIADVTFPVFSEVQADNDRLTRVLKKSTQQVLFWICPVMVLGAALAQPLFRFVLTDKWLPAVPFFQLLCIGGIFRPLNSYTLDAVVAKGRSDIRLKVGIAKRILEIIGILIAIPFGVLALVEMQAFLIIVKYLMNGFFVGRYVHYSLSDQIRHILPTFIVSAVVGGVVYGMYLLTPGWSDITQLIVGGGVGLCLYWMLSKLVKLEAYEEAYTIIKSKIRSIFKKI